MFPSPARPVKDFEWRVDPSCDTRTRRRDVPRATDASRMIEKLGEYWKTIARGRDFHVQAVARGARMHAIDAGKDAVARSHGDILDFKTFSNLSLAMIVEMSGGGVLSLVDALLAKGWDVEVEPDRGALAGRAADLLEGTFQMTFPEGDGELRIPTPAVPG